MIEGRDQGTYSSNSYPRDLVMRINALPKGTSASTWLRTRDLSVTGPLLYRLIYHASYFCVVICIYRSFEVYFLIPFLQDCKSGEEDEEGCYDEYGCHVREFYCEASYRCLDRFRRCDGTVDCPGGDDEKACGLTTCFSDEFRCAGGEPKLYVSIL